MNRQGLITGSDIAVKCELTARKSDSLRTDLALDTPEQAPYGRVVDPSDTLVHHSDSEYVGADSAE